MVDGFSIANHQPPSQVHQLTAQVNLTTSHQCQFVEIVCQYRQSHQPPVIEKGKGDLQNLRLECTPKEIQSYFARGGIKSGPLSVFKGNYN